MSDIINIATLSSRAMLVALHISTWTARKFDKRVSDDVAKQNNAKTDAGRYNKLLVSKKSLETIQQLASDARASHYYNTLPWDDAGYRILTMENFDVYTEKMRKFRLEFDEAVEDFVASYPSYKEEAKDRLGKLFSDDDYPSVADIRRRFDFTTHIMPLPDAKDFRVKLGDEQVAQIQADIEQRVKDQVFEAANDAWRRIHEVVSRMSERLDAYSKRTEGDRSGFFRDSLVDNVVDLANVLPRLNLLGDPQLDKIARDMIDRLGKHSAQELRKDPKVRAQVKRSADEILAAMEGYIGIAPKAAA